MPIDRERFERGEGKYSIEGEILGLLQDEPTKAYNAREITVEVMGLGIAERNVERPTDIQAFMAEFVDVATVCAILDALVDDGVIERRIVDTGEGPRSYYRSVSEPGDLSDE